MEPNSFLSGGVAIYVRSFVLFMQDANMIFFTITEPTTQSISPGLIM